MIVPKKDGGVRIYTDYKKLNDAIKRERYVLPTVKDILHKLKGSTIFSKLDATSGFWQIPLDDESAKLTTLISPFGRYFYRRLPQGITSAPEIFQRTVEETIAREEHAVCFFDDILVFSENEEVHDKHLKNTMEKLNNAGIKLNKEKCQFRQQEIDFLGFVINKDGVKADPRKTEAILEMLYPTNVAELRRFLGMVNYLGRYLQNLSSVLQPVTELLEKDRAWTWAASDQCSRQSQRDVDFCCNTCLLRSRQGYNSECRCEQLWVWRSSFARAPRWTPSCCLRF